jgi:hypothetical protein
MKWVFDFVSQTWTWENYLVQGFLNEQGIAQFVPKRRADRTSDFVGTAILSTAQPYLWDGQDICENDAREARQRC